MYSVARNFSRFSSCLSVVLLVCSTTSSTEQETSGATPGTDVSTLGGAHAVTDAADTEGSRAPFMLPVGAAAPSGVAFVTPARASLATAAEGDFGYSRSTPSNSSLEPSRLPCTARIWASNVLAEAEFSEPKAAARCACSCALEYSRSCAYALANSRCPRCEE